MSSLYRYKEFPTSSMGSRIFLLVLLLATVTCIILLQLSLDSWIVQRGFSSSPSYSHRNENEHASSFDTSFNLKIAPIQISTTTSTSRRTTMVTGWIRLRSHRLQNYAATQSLTFNQTKSESKPKSKIILAEIKEIKFRNKNQYLEPKKNIKTIDALQKMAEYTSKNKASVVKSRGDPLKAIKAMPTVEPNKVQRIMLVSYFRSGSSFTGELLQQNWKTFYQFEPFHYMTYNTRIAEERTEEAFSLLSGIYRCNFTNLDPYFAWVRQPKNQFLFAHSLFLWFSCRLFPQRCFSPPFVSAVCNRSPIQLVKVLRLTMKQVKQFLEENSDLNIKVVYLERDPRGILNSRLGLDWCSNSSCRSPIVLCKEIENDMIVFDELKQKYPSKFIRVRYEDLVSDPAKEASELFKVLELPFSMMAQRFLRSHTSAKNSESSNPYSTRRNSSSLAYSWKQKLTFQQILNIQEFCSDVITKMNLTLVTSPIELDYNSSGANNSTSNIIDQRELVKPTSDTYKQEGDITNKDINKESNFIAREKIELLKSITKHKRKEK